MNTNAYKPKNSTEDLLLSVIKKTGTLIQQTQTKTQETLEFKLTKSRVSFSLDIPLQLTNGEWMLRLSSLEVNISIFNLTNEKNKVENSKSIEKKERPYSSEDFEIDVRNFRPEARKDEVLRPVATDKLKKLSLMTLT